MKKYENKTINLGNVLPYPCQADQQIPEVKLNELGKEGWRLVSVISVGPHSTHALAFLIRELEIRELE